MQTSTRLFTIAVLLHVFTVNMLAQTIVIGLPDDATKEEIEHAKFIAGGVRAILRYRANHRLLNKAKSIFSEDNTVSDKNKISFSSATVVSLSGIEPTLFISSPGPYRTYLELHADSSYLKIINKAASQIALEKGNWYQDNDSYLYLSANTVCFAIKGFSLDLDLGSRYTKRNLYKVYTNLNRLIKSMPTLKCDATSLKGALTDTDGRGLAELKTNRQYFELTSLDDMSIFISDYFEKPSRLFKPLIPVKYKNQLFLLLPFDKFAMTAEMLCSSIDQGTIHELRLAYFTNAKPFEYNVVKTRLLNTFVRLPIITDKTCDP